MSIAKAIKEINPNAEFSITDNDVNNITWLNDTTPISVSDIENKIIQIEYKEKRENEYPSIKDQLDMQYWDKVNGTTTWQDAIAKVKSDNPKE
tara:strand:+ start:462 stop:740 length:279 start_codon:yes stop_codon:yes gene_type:complete